MILQSCCCQMLVWEAWLSNQCFLFRVELKTCCRFACRSLIHIRVGIVCRLLLLQLQWWWLVCTWDCCLVVPILLLLPVLTLHLWWAAVWAVLLLLVLPFLGTLGRCFPLDLIGALFCVSTWKPSKLQVLFELCEYLSTCGQLHAFA